jgi:hypothetical protein
VKTGTLPVYISLRPRQSSYAMAEPTNCFLYAADGTCILKPHLVLDKVHAIGIRTRINASEIGRWQTPSDDGPVSALGLAAIGCLQSLHLF